MRKHHFAVLLLLAASLLLIGPTSRPSAAIVGGQTTSRSWAAAIIHPDQTKRMEDRIQCSGALLGPRVVVTAKHCLQYIGGHKVVIGRADLTVSSGAVRSIQKTKSYGNADVALLYLSSNTTLKPLPMFASTPLGTGNDVYPYGYGRTSTTKRDGSRLLRRTTVRVNKIADYRFVATWDCRGIKQGDSGGAATKYVDGKEYLAGIISQTYLNDGADPCAGGGYGGVFVRATPGGPTAAVYNWLKTNRNGW